MFKVFHGPWRGPRRNQGKTIFYLQVAFETRKILKYFKGSTLAVFMCLALHMDKEGHSFPCYEQIRRDTGLSLATIARAQEQLCALRIEGQPVLLRYRVRDEHQRFVGGNHFIVFPTPEQFEAYTENRNRNPIFPHSQNA